MESNGFLWLMTIRQLPVGVLGLWSRGSCSAQAIGLHTPVAFPGQCPSHWDLLVKSGKPTVVLIMFYVRLSLFICFVRSVPSCDKTTVLMPWKNASFCPSLSAGSHPLPTVSIAFSMGSEVTNVCALYFVCRIRPPSRCPSSCRVQLAITVLKRTLNTIKHSLTLVEERRRTR